MTLICDLRYTIYAVFRGEDGSTRIPLIVAKTLAAGKERRERKKLTADDGAAKNAASGWARMGNKVRSNTTKLGTPFRRLFGFTRIPHAGQVGKKEDF